MKAREIGIAACVSKMEASRLPEIIRTLLPGELTLRAFLVAGHLIRSPVSVEASQLHRLPLVVPDCPVLGDLAVNDPLEVRVPDGEPFPGRDEDALDPPSWVQPPSRPYRRPDMWPKVTTRSPSTTCSSVDQVRSL